MSNNENLVWIFQNLLEQSSPHLTTLYLDDLKLDNPTFYQLNSSLEVIKQYFMKNEEPCRLTKISLAKNSNLSYQNWKQFFMIISEMGR